MRQSSLHWYMMLAARVSCMAGRGRYCEYKFAKVYGYLDLSSLSPGCSLEYSSIGSRFLRPV